MNINLPEFKHWAHHKSRLFRLPHDSLRFFSLVIVLLYLILNGSVSQYRTLPSQAL